MINSIREALRSTITKRVILIVTTFAVLMTILQLCSGCSGVAKAAPQELAEQTQVIVDEVKVQDQSVYQEIQQNIDSIVSLRQEIMSAGFVTTEREQSLSAVIGELERITASYESLAAQRDTIRDRILGKANAIVRLQSSVQTEIAGLYALRQRYNSELSEFVSADPEIVRTRKAALEQAITYVDMQVQLWLDFQDTEVQIYAETMGVQQRVDSFLSMIESTAILFREGLNLLKLQRDISDAMSLLTNDIPAMEKLTVDMEQSWQHLDTLVGTLTNISIKAE